MNDLTLKCSSCGIGISGRTNAVPNAKCFSCKTTRHLPTDRKRALTRKKSCAYCGRRVTKGRQKFCSSECSKNSYLCAISQYPVNIKIALKMLKYVCETFPK